MSRTELIARIVYLMRIGVPDRIIRTAVAKLRKS
jgi:hypothetical protein